MPRVNHFAIPADVPERAITFYHEVFGWDFEVAWEYEAPQGREKYWRVITGQEASHGIDGGLTRRVSESRFRRLMRAPISSKSAAEKQW